MGKTGKNTKNKKAPSRHTERPQHYLEPEITDVTAGSGGDVVSNEIPDSPMFDLIKRAENGDESALSEVRDFIDTKAPEMWGIWGDVAENAQRRWVKRISENNPMAQEGLKRHLSEMKSELAEGREPSPLENLLIDRIAVCWLQLYDIETGCIDALRGG